MSVDPARIELGMMEIERTMNRRSQEPLTLCVAIFGVVAAFVLAFGMSLHLPGVSLLTYILVGVSYSGFLAFYSVGLTLTPRKARVGIVSLCLGFMIVFEYWVLIAFTGGGEFLMANLWILGLLTAFALGTLIVGGVLSFYGWIAHFRRRGRYRRVRSQ